MSGLQVLFYVSIVVFLAGVAYKAIKLARMPLHLRWDLYPIPHEKGKGHYGGSYFEETDWWTRPAKVAISSELKEVAKEILFIQSMYHNNRPLWMFSFPFHFGLYLSVLFVLLVYAGAALGLLGIDVASASPSQLGRVLHAVTIPLGLAGAALGGLGALGLFFSRMFHTQLRRTSVWTDYFNVALLVAVFGTTLWTWATLDRSFAGARAFISSLLTLSPQPPLTPLAYTHYLLAALFLLWLPFTHMTHFVGKYFTYHKVRWEDKPNIRGSELESAVIDALGKPIRWSASHIKAGATWAEAAMDEGGAKKNEKVNKKEKDNDGA